MDNNEKKEKAKKAASTLGKLALGALAGMGCGYFGGRYLQNGFESGKIASIGGVAAVIGTTVGAGYIALSSIASR